MIMDYIHAFDDFRSGTSNDKKNENKAGQAEFDAF